MVSKAAMQQQNVLRHIELLQCPQCGGAFVRLQNHAIFCENNHTFNFSRRGAVNFYEKPVDSVYTKELFTHRRTVFAMGAYNTVFDALRAELDAVAPGAVIIDAGCGEGSYLSAVARKEDSTFGVDIEKDAIDLAARDYSNSMWFVADITRLPFAPQTADVVLNVLTPAAYDSFRRVLKPGGLLIKLVPGSGYLQELRNAGQMEPYTNQNVVNLFMRQFPNAKQRQIVYSVPLDAPLANAFWHMTPLLSAQKENMPPVDLRHVTIDFTLLCAQV